MICDFDDGDPSTTTDDITLDIYRGMGLRIKQGPQPGAWGPGNFGLLDLPEDAAYGVGGANAVEAALAAEEPLGCYAVSTITTATGVIAQKVADGVNIRWNDPGPVAPNVMNYPRDNDMNPEDPVPGLYDPTINFGNGAWNLGDETGPANGYWFTRHPGPNRNMPPKLAGATRYQIYLFEQGVVYYKKAGGKTVQFVVDPAESEELGGPWKKVDIQDYIGTAGYEALESPPGSGKALPVWSVTGGAHEDDNDWDGVPPTGVPETTLDPSYKRRVMKIAVAECAEAGFNGQSELPADGVFLEIFLTEEAEEPPQMAIYGEIIGKITANTSLEFHGNVRLVE